jgi:GMP synthase-like glutamine amidotransferase
VSPKPVIIVRNEAADPGGTVLEELQADGLAVRMVDAFLGEPLPHPGQVAGIVVFGGVQHADDVVNHPYLMDEQDLLRVATEAGVPVLGICLGGQILALAMGAALRESPVREFGYTPISPTDAGRQDPVLSVWEPGDRVFHWHEDTFDLPAGATLLLEGEHVRNQAFRFGDSSWGLQFHPEVTEAVIEGWLAVAGDIEPKWGKTAQDIREEGGRYLEDEEKRAREMVRRFAAVVRGHAEADPDT